MRTKVEVTQEMKFAIGLVAILVLISLSYGLTMPMAHALDYKTAHRICEATTLPIKLFAGLAGGVYGGAEGFAAGWSIGESIDAMIPCN